VREWVAAHTRDPALVRPYSLETVNSEAYADMRAFRGPIIDVHQYNFYILLALIAIHIASAIVTEFREGGAVITAMFTGRKDPWRRTRGVRPDGQATYGRERR
jgi:cytochrome b561